jgi:hypothetical protein
MFQFAGFASHGYGFTVRYPCGWVAPFGDSGIKGCSRLPRTFRSVPRPSSPLDAKAFTRCPWFTRPAPAASPLLQKRLTLSGTHSPSQREATRASPVRNTASRANSRRSNNKHTMLGDRPIPDQDSNGEPSPSQSGMDELMRPTPSNAEDDTRLTPCPIRRSIALPAFDQTCLFTMYKEHPLERPPDTATAAIGRPFRGNHVTSLSHPTVIRQPKPSRRGMQSRYRHARCWWAWADLNSRPHAYQACALTN